MFLLLNKTLKMFLLYGKKIIHDVIVKYGNQYKNSAKEILLIEALRMNNIDDKILFDIFKNNHKLLSFEQLVSYNLIDFYKHKIKITSCLNKCKCLDNSIDNVDFNFISLILNNNICSFSVPFVWYVINSIGENTFNTDTVKNTYNNDAAKNIFCKLIAIIKRLDRSNLLFLINKINYVNFDLIKTFYNSVFSYFKNTMYLYRENINHIFKTNDINIIKYFICNQNIYVTYKIINIYEENYDVYRLFYDNSIDYKINNLSTINDCIDIKAYHNNDINFLKFCITNNCKKNIKLIDDVIINNDCDILSYLFDNGYVYNTEINNVELITTHKVFKLLLTKIDNISIQNCIVKFLNNNFSLNSDIILFHDNIINADDLFTNMSFNDNYIFCDEFILFFISNKKYKNTFNLLKNKIIFDDVFKYLIKFYDVIYYDLLIKNKNNNLITLFASKYNKKLLTVLLNNDFAINKDCILYLCENNDIDNLTILLDKISESFYIFFRKFIPEYENLLCCYYKNFKTLFDNFIFTNDDVDTVIHYLLLNIDENNSDIYEKIFSYYKTYLKDNKQIIENY